MATLGKFRSDLHAACSKDDFRPAMQLVHFSNGYAYATNAHILVKQSLAWLEFSPEDIAILNGKSLTIEGFKLARKATVLDVREEHLVARVKDTTFQIDYADTSLKFPDAEKVLSELLQRPLEQLDTFGLTPSVVKTVLSAMVFDGTIKLQLRGKNRGIIVLDTATEPENQICLAMPTLDEE